jgi:acyl-CoA dehydrogenase
MQAFGGAGTNNDYGLASAYATARLLRIADGPDEVHRAQLGRMEIKRYRNIDARNTGAIAEPHSIDTVRPASGKAGY